MPKKNKNKSQAEKPPKKKNKKKTKNKKMSNETPVEQSYYAPVAKNYITRNGRNTSLRPNVFKKRELVTTIKGVASGFGVRTFSINPGLSATFPWLSVAARQYDLYKVHHLKFEYIPRCPTSTPGYIVMGLEYDVSNPDPKTDVELTTYKNAMEGDPFDRLCFYACVRDLHGSNPKMQVRSNYPGEALTTYDGGRFMIGVSGQTSTASIGKLWVEYEIEFFAPSVPLDYFYAPARLSIFQLGQSVVLPEAANLTVGEWVPWQGSSNAMVGNGLGIGVDSLTTDFDTFILPVGMYKMTVVMEFNRNLGSTDYQLRVTQDGADFTTTGYRTLPMYSIAIGADVSIGPEVAFIRRVAVGFLGVRDELGVNTSKVQVQAWADTATGGSSTTFTAGSHVIFEKYGGGGMSVFDQASFYAPEPASELVLFKEGKDGICTAPTASAVIESGKKESRSRVAATPNKALVSELSKLLPNTDGKVHRRVEAGVCLRKLGFQSILDVNDSDEVYVGFVKMGGVYELHASPSPTATTTEDGVRIPDIRVTSANKKYILNLYGEPGAHFSYWFQR